MLFVVRLCAKWASSRKVSTGSDSDLVALTASSTRSVGMTLAVAFKPRTGVHKTIHRRVSDE
jgi:hypothetical protein